MAKGCRLFLNRFSPPPDAPFIQAPLAERRRQATRKRAPPVFGGAGAPGAQPGDVLRAATRWRALPSPLGSARACAGEGAGDPGLVLALG